MKWKCVKVRGNSSLRLSLSLLIQCSIKHSKQIEIGGKRKSVNANHHQKHGWKILFWMLPIFRIQSYIIYGFKKENPFSDTKGFCNLKNGVECSCDDLIKTEFRDICWLKSFSIMSDTISTLDEVVVVICENWIKLQKLIFNSYLFVFFCIFIL